MTETRKRSACGVHAGLLSMAQTSLSKVTFGNNNPGWATQISQKPAVIVLQVGLHSRLRSLTLREQSSTSQERTMSQATSSGCAGVVGSDRRSQKASSLLVRQ